METKMNEPRCLISPWRTARIKEQGYGKSFTNQEIAEHAVGNRFAYQMCTLLFTTGIVLTSIPVLSVAAAIALLGVVLPNHPFDYVYNYTVRYWLGRPKLPRRSPQAKFACGIASVWLAIIVLLFQASLFVWGYLLGAVLFIIAFLVSIFDLCIPSLLFNTIFKPKIRDN